MAGPSSNLGSAPRGGFPLWATSNEEMQKGLGEWRWMNCTLWIFAGGVWSFQITAAVQTINPHKVTYRRRIHSECPPRGLDLVWHLCLVNACAWVHSHAPSIQGRIEGHLWFSQISSQWETQTNRFALISFGKIQFLPPSCICDFPFMSYRLWCPPADWLRAMADGIAVRVVRLRGGPEEDDNELGGPPPPPFWNYTRIGEVDGTDGLAAGGGGGAAGEGGNDCLDHTHLNAPR
jgi:hypothetical protein